MSYTTVTVGDLKRTHTCAVCKTNYTEIDNIGNWRCRQHPGQVVDGRFTCCNMETSYANRAEFMKNCISTRLRGCVPCDHSPVPRFFSTNDAIVIVPTRFISVISANETAIIQCPDPSNSVMISRFNHHIKSKNDEAIRQWNSAQMMSFCPKPFPHVLMS